jgi:hypothetical protein
MRLLLRLAADQTSGARRKIMLGKRLNYRRADLTIDCLRSLESEVAGHSNCRVTVVDNASGDGSAYRIEQVTRVQGWQDWVQLMRSSVNGRIRGWKQRRSQDD